MHQNVEGSLKNTKGLWYERVLYNRIAEIKRKIEKNINKLI
jgi:hypothetical protein